MKLAELQKEAASLSQADKVTLVCSLLDTLPKPDWDVSDDDVLQREKEMNSGAVKPVSHEEFVAGVQRERAR